MKTTIVTKFKSFSEFPTHKHNHDKSILIVIKSKNLGREGIRTRACEETGASNQCLRPLGHTPYFIDDMLL